MVWAGISLGDHTDLHLFHGGNLIGERYCDAILDAYVKPYADAIGNDFILVDDNDLTELCLLRIILRVKVWSEWNGQLNLHTLIRQNMFGTTLADK